MMTSPSTGEGHKITLNFHLIYADVGGACVRVHFILLVCSQAYLCFCV